MEEQYDQSYILELAYKIKTGIISDEELSDYNKWYSSENKDFLELPKDYVSSPLVVRDRIHDKLMIQVESENPIKTLQLRSVWWKSVAAAVVLIGVLLFFINRNQPGTVKQDATITKVDIGPGKQSATLTLADGKRITLSEDSKGVLAQEAGLNITNAAEGMLVYDRKGQGQGTTNKVNTLTTARGETYQVRLPDGSLVWLNAASSLTYAFSLNERGERRVKLTGEAYFEIAKDKKHPFVVSTDDQEVAVLGTHFNINSYGDELVTATTLLEGSIRVSAAGNEKVLKPGQEATLGAKGLMVGNADLTTATAWMEGQMVFKTTDVKRVLRQISRWYNVDVEYRGKLPNYTITGEVSRRESLSSILKLLELSDVHFELIGRKLVILP